MVLEAAQALDRADGPPRPYRFAHRCRVRSDSATIYRHVKGAGASSSLSVDEIVTKNLQDDDVGFDDGMAGDADGMATAGSLRLRRRLILSVASFLTTPSLVSCVNAARE
jgi:hypothetical protein